VRYNGRRIDYIDDYALVEEQIGSSEASDLLRSSPGPLARGKTAATHRPNQSHDISQAEASRAPASIGGVMKNLGRWTPVRLRGTKIAAETSGMAFVIIVLPNAS